MSLVEKFNIKKTENFHVLLWLLKDIFWCADFRLLGTVLIFPTISLALYIAWISRKSSHDFLPNLAVCCWISANSVWMIGEFFFNDTTRPFALGFFVIGILMMGMYYYKELKAT